MATETEMKLGTEDTKDSVQISEFDHLSTHEIRRLNRKIDIRVVAPLVMIYTFTFLDRVNIGNARVYHMEEDLSMKGYDYSIAVLIFYVPFIILEIPANMVIKVLNPRYWLSFLILSFGLVVTFSGLCKVKGTLYLCRVLLGIGEAGVFPGCLFLLSSWYRRRELQTRIAYFFVANDIAGAVGGILAYGIGRLDGNRGLSGWSWVYLIEGSVTCVIGIIAFFTLPGFPQKCTFLTTGEKSFMLARIAEAEKENHHEKITKKHIITSLKDWKLFAGGLMFFCTCLNSYAISIFLPTILKSMGFTSRDSNGLAAPIRVASGIFSVSCAILSDRLGRRAPFCIGGFSFAALGNILVLSVTKSGPRYFGCYLAAIGTYITQAVVMTWVSNNVVGPVYRNIYIALVASVGQISGIVSSFMFPKEDSPRYVLGIALNIGTAGVGIILTLMLWANWKYHNAKWDKKAAQGGADVPEWRFVL